MVDTSPEAIGAAFGNLMTGGIGTAIMKTLGWIMVLAIIGAIFWVIYLFVIYKFKAKIICIGGSGSSKRDESYAVGKVKNDFAKRNKDGSWSFLFGKKKIEPISSKYIYPGNKIYMFELDGELIPGKIECNNDKFDISPIPYTVRKKAELELQQLEQDFAKMDKWEANKYFIYMLIGATVVIVFAGFVLWLAFKKTDNLVPAMETMTNTMKNWNNIPGRG